VTNVTLSLSLGLTLATIIIISIADFGTVKAYGQSMTATTPGMNNTIMQQHAAHILDNLIISEHIPLTGQLTSGDYMLLMDFTPFATSVEGHSHIAMKAPCNQDGSPKVTIVAGVSPNLSTLNMGNAINNGTLNGKNLDLSNEGKSCLYRAELPNGITDIALINTSNGTLNFNEGGYSVTVSVHGTAIQHIAK
jgi:acyl-[acyl carrier protein]--UDP-N-acetylglucosamine O-acyltransferase